MIEVLITLTILVVGIGAMTMSLMSTAALRKANRETSLAMEAAQSAIEAVRGEPFDRAFVNFNADPNDDSDGPGTGPGKFLAVRGLMVRQGDPDGFVGEIIFPGDGVTLREDLADQALGMPRDLNADNVVDNADHSADYTLLPVRVLLEWGGTTGNGSIEVVTSIVGF